MATNRAPGFFVTPDIWNAVLTSINDAGTIWSGGFAISGQATNRIPYASSASQLATSASLNFDGTTLSTVAFATSTIVATSNATTRPIQGLGSDSATSGIVASLYSNTSGRAAVIHLSDAFTYNLGIGANTIGGFNVWANRSPGVAGTSIFSVALTGINAFLSPVTQTNAAYLQVANTGGAAYFGLDNSAAGVFGVGNYAAVVYSDSSAGVAIRAADVAGTVRIYTVDEEWVRVHASGGVSIGDITDPGAANLRVAGTSTLVGAVTHSMVTTLTGAVRIGSTNITDGVGTPTLVGSDFGTGATIVGKSYGFVITTGGSATGGGSVNFGTTYANPPIVTVSLSASGDTNVTLVNSVSTTAVGLANYDGGVAANWASGRKIYVHVRGY